MTRWKFKRLEKLLANRKHLNSNDCWCDAISIATGMTYEETYAIFKPMLADGGGLDCRIIEGFMLTKGFYCTEVENCTVETGLKMYESTNNSVMFGLDGHSVAVVKNKICEVHGALDIFNMQIKKVFWKPLTAPKEGK